MKQPTMRQPLQTVVRRTRDTGIKALQKGSASVRLYGAIFRAQTTYSSFLYQFHTAHSAKFPTKPQIRPMTVALSQA